MGVIVVNPYSVNSYNNSYSFTVDGVDEWATRATNATLQPIALSYSCWVKTSVSTAGIMSQYYWNGGLSYNGCVMYNGGTGKCVAASGNGGNQTTAVGTTTITTGAWFHLVTTFSATESKVYVNGVLEATNSSAQYSNALATATTFTIGRDSESGTVYAFNGKIANPAVIGRVITLSEVQAAYALKMGNLKNLFGTDLKFAGYFPSGTSDYPTLKDYSGNGFDMTLTNMESVDITTDIPV